MSESRAARIAVIVIGVVVVAFLIFLATRGPSQVDVSSVAHATADELERTPVRGLGVYEADVAGALARATPTYRGVARHSYKVREVGRDAYEITDSSGGHPVCLKVSVQVALTAGTVSYPDVSVTDGHC